MKRGALEGLICVLLLLFTCPLLASTLLAPGDRLAIVQPGEPAFDQPFQINKQGEIALPEVGNVVVGGKTLQQADELIRRALQLCRTREAAERILVQQPEQEDRLHVADIEVAIGQLPARQREMLMLIASAAKVWIEWREGLMDGWMDTYLTFPGFRFVRYGMRRRTR